MPLLGTPIRTGYASVVTPTTGTIASYKPLAGDIICSFLRCGNAAPTWTVPANWVNPLGGTTLSAAGDCSELAIYHVITAAEQIASTAAWTFSSMYGSSQTGATYSCAVRGVSSVTAVDTTGVADSVTTTNSQTLPGITPVYTGSIVVCGIGGDGTAIYSSPSTGWSLRVASAGGQNSGALLSMDALTVAGATIGNGTVSIGTSGEYASITVAFAPIPNANNNLNRAPIIRSSLW